jgi:hypothetical protein
MPVARKESLALPDFLLIGVAKAGTSWIFEILREHPDVFVPVAKDIMFFNRYYAKGLAWYSRFFAERTDEKVGGELSHDYYLSEETARRIHDTLPDAKLICCLRETVDKLISAYVYNISTGHATMSFEDYVNYGEVSRNRKAAFDEYVEVSFARQVEYYENLKPYYDLFPREQILILFFEDLKRDPAGFARRLYAFLGVDPDFVPPSLHERSNPARVARNPLLAHTVFRIAQVFRGLGMANFVGAVKRNKVFNALLYRAEKPAVVVSEEARHRVYERYRPTYERLEELIGRPLPREWYRGEGGHGQT